MFHHELYIVSHIHNMKIKDLTKHRRIIIFKCVIVLLYLTLHASTPLNIEMYTVVLYPVHLA
jgi:hypothetical protein